MNDPKVVWTRAAYDSNARWDKALVAHIQAGDGICCGLCHAWISAILLDSEYPWVMPELAVAQNLQDRFGTVKYMQNGQYAKLEFCDSYQVAKQAEAIAVVYNYNEDDQDLQTAFLIVGRYAGGSHMVAIIRGPECDYFLGPNSGLCTLNTRAEALQRISQEPGIQTWEEKGPFAYEVYVISS